MNITATILKDSITDGASRLTTWLLRYPRFVHAELLTHRVMSRNSASSRAIPTARFRANVVEDPAVHASWGANQRGMHATAEIEDTAAAREWWLRGRDLMVAHHEEGERLGLHKQVVNRVLEPWMMISVIVSMTDHANFYSLRTHEDAEPNIRVLARLMWDKWRANLPDVVPVGGWHVPMADDLGGEPEERRIQVATGRIARVSYETHHGVRDPSADVELHDKLAGTMTEGNPGHYSPFEHVAEAIGGRERVGNFEGWRQYRFQMPRHAGPDVNLRCDRCGLWGGLCLGEHAAPENGS